MDGRRNRFFHIRFDEFVVYAWEKVATWMVIDCGVESSDVYTLSDPTTKPVIIDGEDVKVVFSDVVVVVSGMLYDRRFILAGSAEGS